MSESLFIAFWEAYDIISHQLISHFLLKRSNRSRPCYAHADRNGPFYVYGIFTHIYKLFSIQDKRLGATATSCRCVDQEGLVLTDGVTDPRVCLCLSCLAKNIDCWALPLPGSVCWLSQCLLKWYHISWMRQNETQRQSAPMSLFR